MNLKAVLYWAWFLLACFVAYIDSNWWFARLIVVWIAIALFIFGPKDRPRWLNAEFIQPLVRFFDEVAWKQLLLLTISLFVVGNGIFSIQTSTIMLISGDSVRSIKSNQLTLHIPLVERVEVWKTDVTYFQNGATFTTLDGKSFSADIVMNLRMIPEGYPRLEDLALQYGNNKEYKEAYHKAIHSEFERIFSGMTLEQIATTPQLMLADYVGSSIDLSFMGLEKSGVISIDNIKFVAGN